MTISLPPHLEEMVRRKVESGLYASTTDVLAHALRALDLHDQDEAEKLQALRRDIQEGIDSGSAGEFVLDDFLAEVRAERHGPC